MQFSLPDDYKEDIGNSWKKGVRPLQPREYNSTIISKVNQTK